MTLAKHACYTLTRDMPSPHGIGKKITPIQEMQSNNPFQTS